MDHKYRRIKLTNLFTLIIFLVSAVMGAFHFYQKIPITPYICALNVLFIGLIFSLRKKMSEDTYQVMGGLSGTMTVVGVSLYTGGFSSPSLSWLLPVFIYITIAYDKSSYKRYLVFLFCTLGLLLALELSGNMPMNILKVKNHSLLINMISRLFSILVSVLLMNLYRKEKESLTKSLNESDERNKLIIQTSGTGIWDWMDINKDEVYWSDLLFAMLKLDPKKVKPLVSTFRSMMAEGEYERSRRITDQQIKTGSHFQGIVKMIRADGEVIWVQNNGLVLKNANGFPYRMIGSIQDITDLILSREQLESEKEKALAASHAKSIFLSNMTHEVRTPLNAIIGLSEILRKKLEGTDQYELIEDINESAEMLFSLVSDILDIGKIQEMKLELHPVATNLNELLVGSERTFSTLAKKKNIKFSVESTNITDKIFMLDDLRFKQILNNILNNAFKFTEVGEVALSVNFKDKVLYVSVRDSGLGIKEEDLSHIFDSFQQCDSTLSKKYRGTGLGLYIVKGLLDQMKGSIGVVSTFGKGSTFDFKMPLYEASGEALEVIKKEKTLQESPMNFSYLKVLLVEDNHLNRKVMENYLSSFNVSYDVAVNGIEAVENCENSKYDLIFMDLQMPLMDGLEASKHILKLPTSRETRIVALTANALEETRSICLEHGMCDFVSKPVKRADIARILANLIKS